MKGVFVTGTNTDVGKTHIAVLLAKQLGKHITVTPRKPIESGCSFMDGELVPEDALALKEATNYQGTLQDICPFRFELAISPQRAAALANCTVTTQQLAAACATSVEETFVLVEGAGGFYSPLCSDGLNADLAVALQLPVLLVSDNRLGCINQVLLSVEAIHSRGLKLCAVIVNETGKQEDTQMNNVEDISQLIDTPVIYNPFNEERKQQLPGELIKLLM